MQITTGDIEVRVEQRHTLVLDDEELRSLGSALLRTRCVDEDGNTLVDPLWEPVVEAINEAGIRLDADGRTFHSLRKANDD